MRRSVSRSYIHVQVMMHTLVLLSVFVVCASAGPLEEKAPLTSNVTPLLPVEDVSNETFVPSPGSAVSELITLQNDDKGFWEWISNVVAGALVNTSPQPVRPPTSTEAPQKPEDCIPCTCGVTNKHNRIVGGVETKVNEYPWMAMMYYKDALYCGGSVINSRYVLTAAHCVQGLKDEFTKIRILEHDKTTSTEAKSQEFQVEKIIRHSGYSTITYNNDIALLKLKDPVQFEGLMRPVCLPDRGKTFAKMTGIATGWGRLMEGGAYSDILQEVTVPILSNAECRSTKYPSKRITDNMLCAGMKEGGKDSCQGDSGGPLHVVDENNVHQVVGIVSWGEGCARPDYPGIYARVNRFLTWIEKNTIDSCYCTHNLTLRA